MSRLMQLVIICLSALFMMSAQAGDMPTKTCLIFADGAVDDGAKQDGEKPEEDSEEEEEPDCD